MNEKKDPPHSGHFLNIQKVYSRGKRGDSEATLFPHPTLRHPCFQVGSFQVGKGRMAYC